MTLRSATKNLLVLALALPIIQAVLVWIRMLLGSTGDEAGAAVVGHIGTACQIAWPISLVGLVIALALMAMGERRPDE
jgi:hypothetical protein